MLSIMDMIGNGVINIFATGLGHKYCNKLEDEMQHSGYKNHYEKVRM
jgi:hypothetical protein